MDLLDLVTPEDAIEFWLHRNEQGPFTRPEAQESRDKLAKLALAMAGNDIEFTRAWGPALTVLDAILQFKTSRKKVV